MRSASRRYCTVVLSSLAIAGLVAFAVNTTVNPLRVTPMPWSSNGFDPYRDFPDQIRTGKAGLVRSSAKIGVAIVGSSRVANGMDPDFPGWQRDDVVNLGCSGGYLYESAALARYLLERHDVEILLFGVDPGDLTSSADTRPMGDFNESPLGDPREAINREMRYLIGVSTLEESIATLVRRARGERPEYGPKGLRNPERRTGGSQLDFIRAKFRGEAKPESKGGGDSFAAIEGNAVVLRTLNPDKARVLEELMRAYRARGARFIAFLHPVHALNRARAGDARATPVYYESDRRGLLEIATRINAEDGSGPPVEVWDFNDFHPLNCDPLPGNDSGKMPHWGDLGHYSIEIGNLIQSRLMGWPVTTCGGDDFGTRLTPTNLSAHLERVREGYRRYLAGPGVKDVEWKEQVISAALRGE